MKRRNLLAATLVGAGFALPRSAGAAPSDAWTNVLFRESDLGHWAAVEKLHVPIVRVHDGKMTIRTPHPMTEPHYIVSHTVVLADGRFLDRKTFNWKDQPVSEHSLPAGYRGTVIVTSTCNLHDLWVKSVEV